jgi:hypothetical protein
MMTDLNILGALALVATGSFASATQPLSGRPALSQTALQPAAIPVRPSRRRPLGTGAILQPKDDWS